MKYIVLSVLSVVLFLGSAFYNDTSKTSENSGIIFETKSFDEALKLSKSSNKLIFLDAYAAWCGPCKYMAANTFKDENVANLFNENFINLKIDMEKGEGPALAKRYSVTAYPTLLFINGDGEVFHKVLGAKRAEEFLNIAQKVLSANK